MRDGRVLEDEELETAGVRILVRIVEGLLRDSEAISASNAGPPTRKCSKNSAWPSFQPGCASTVCKGGGAVISGSACVPVVAANIRVCVPTADVTVGTTKCEAFVNETNSKVV